MSHWTRRLVLPTALGLDLVWRLESEDRPFESWVGGRFDEYVTSLKPLQSEAVAKGLEACRRAARARDGGWFRKIGLVRDPVVRPVMDLVEEWLEPTSPEQAAALAEELESLERAFVGDTTLLGDPKLGLREAQRLPEEGKAAAAAVEKLYEDCAAALEGWVGKHLPAGARAATPAVRGVIQRAILAAGTRLASVHTSLRPIDVRCSDDWYAGSERLLTRLRGDLGQAAEAFGTAAADEDPDLAPSSANVNILVQRLRHATGIAAVVGELQELQSDTFEQRTENLAALVRDLDERIAELRELDRERSTPRPATVRVSRDETRDSVPRMLAMQKPVPVEEDRTWYVAVWQHIWDASVVFSRKAAFSMAASFALSSIFVVLTTLGFFEILNKALANGAGSGSGPSQLESLVFTTMFPQCLGELLKRTHELDAMLSAGGLYVLLGVLFLYFTISLQVSLAGNLNYLFDIETTHSFFDLRYVFGIFARGYFVRLAVVGTGIALALGGYAFLIGKLEIAGHPLVGSVFAVVLVAYLVVLGLPLDDVPVREKMVFGLLIGPLLPVYNAGFDYMFYNFQSYKLMMVSAPVAMLTLWLYFAWVAVLFGLSLLQAFRNRKHIKRVWTRPAVVFEVLRLASEELTFDELLVRIGTSREQLRDVIDGLVLRNQLEQYSPHIKVTAYVGDYHYRIPRVGLSVSQLRLVLFPDQVDAMSADVPVEVRKGVAEMVEVLEAAIAHQAQVDASNGPPSAHGAPSTAWPIKGGSTTAEMQQQDSLEPEHQDA